MTIHPNIIGREDEIKLLESCYNSGKAEMVIVYGRRRVGKTYLIKKLFSEDFAFYMTGLYQTPKKRQLTNFAYSLSEFSGNDEEVPDTWVEAFRRLKQYLKELNTPGRKVVFIDELPWLDTKRGDLLEALELFWNGWGNNQDDLMLILCGSATSWITDKLLGNKGGLFNRDTLRLYLSPFNLHETQLFLQSKNINASQYEIAEYYMVMGGIPYYLDKIQRGMSVAQNIDLLFFKRRGLLWDEFKHLYKTLFANNRLYVEIVRILSSKREGYSREEIVKKLGTNSNGDITKCLNDLCDCDFILPVKQYGNASNNVIYRLADLYTLFYFKFLQNIDDEHYWSNNLDSPVRRAWTGFAFEQVCFWHKPQLKQALGVAGVSCEFSALRITNADKNAQIDMLIDRRDNIINLCEIKFSREEYNITSQYYQSLVNKREALQSVIPSRQSIHTTMITTMGLRPNKYSIKIDNSITLTDLFAK